MFFGLLSVVAPLSVPISAVPPGYAAPDLGSVPKSFVENRGQWRKGVRYASVGGDLRAGFEKNSILLQSKGGETIRLTFVAASSDGPKGVRQTAGQYNFILGKNRAGWRTGVRAYERLIYDDIYRGIDLQVREHQGNLEYDLLMDPGASVTEVKVRAEGAKKLEVKTDGTLVIETESGMLSQKPPLTWQITDEGSERPVRCEYRLIDRSTYGFRLVGADPKLRTVIDPGLEWSTYFGGNDREEIRTLFMAPDRSGDVIIAGHTFSPDFPATAGTLGEDRMKPYIARIGAGGTRVVYATMFGSASAHGEFLLDMAIDSRGGPVISGTTRSPDLPVTPGAYDTTYSGTTSNIDDAFIARFDPSGGLVFSTYFGVAPVSDPNTAGGFRGGYEEASQVAVDPSGNVIFGGRTSSPNLPTTSGAYDRTLSDMDLFVARLSPTGSQLTYCSFFGNVGGEIMNGLVVDAAGNVTFVGDAWYDAPNAYPTTADAVQRTHAGNMSTHSDGFLTRMQLNGGGSADLRYSTIIGGNNSESLTGIALDPLNPELVTICGHSRSWDFRTTRGAQRRSPISPDDWQMAFASRYRFTSGAPGALVWSTLLGGPGYQGATGVSVDSGGQAFVAGWGGMDFPTTQGAYMRASVSQDAFIARVTADGRSIAYASLLGGSKEEYDTVVAALEGNRAVVGGRTISPDFPTTPGALDRILNANGNSDHLFNTTHRADGFLSQLHLEPLSTVDTTAPAPTLIAPAQGAAFPKPTELNHVEILFDWSDVSDPAGIRLYQIEVSPDPDFVLNRLNVAEWQVWEPTESQKRMSFVPFFGHEGRYYWRVRTLDGLNNWSDWSTVRFFNLGESLSPRLSHVKLSTNEVIGGGTVQVTAVLQDRPAPAGGFSLQVFSSNPMIAPVPSTITVPAGADRVSFTITTRSVGVSTPVRINIGDSGIPDSNVLWVDPGTAPAASLSTVSVSPTSVTGGASATGTVTLTAAAPSAGFPVSLTSSNTAVATVPAWLTVASGATSASFAVVTRAVSASTTITISATAGSVVRTTTLTVNPPATATLATLTLNPTSVAGGASSTGTATLSGAAPAGGATVTLSSSNTGAATVPASVTIAAGATAASFAVTTRTVTATTSVTISGSYAGVTRSATLTVTAQTATDTVRITRAEYESRAAVLRVEATSTNASAVLQVYVTSSNQLIGTLRNEGGGRYRAELTWGTNPGNITVRSNFGGSSSAAVVLR
jgi:hypothetical protein